MARCWHCPPRWPRPASSRRSASASSAGRAPRRRRQAREVDRFSLAAMFGFAALCLLAGILPGVVIDALAPVAQALTGARMPAQLGDAVAVHRRRSRAQPQLVQRPSGVRVHRRVGLLTALVSIASPRARCAGRLPGTADFPMPRPGTQYTGGSFAQPIRRVFGAVVFRAQRDGRHAAAGRRSAPASIEKHIATRSGTASTRRSPARVAASRTG